MPFNYTCAVCGAAFVSRHSPKSRQTPKVCSTRCSGIIKHRRALKSCLRCGKEFEAPASRAGVYCSPLCFTEHRKEKRMKPCEVCGKVFLPYGGRTHLQRFCSTDCQHTGLWKGKNYRFKVIDGVRHKAHRHAMEQYIGRPLLKTEYVHHRNGLKGDNRLENLELWLRHHPPGQRVEEQVVWAREILELYADYRDPT